MNWDAIDRIRPQDDAVPVGSFTALEYARQYDMSIRAARDALDDFVRVGKLATGTKRAADRAGRRQRQHFFWIPEVQHAPVDRLGRRRDHRPAQLQPVRKGK
jgi:hypothetical protein